MLDEPRRHIGSTSCAAILGVSPFQTAHDVFRELRGIHKPAAVPHMIRGNACEPLLARLVAEMLREDLESVEPVDAPGGVACMRVKGDYKIKRAPRTLLELKTSAFFAYQSWGGVLPEYIRMQTVIEMWANDADRTIVPVLVIPSALIEVEAMLVGKPREYMEMVLGALAPVMVEAGELKVFHVDADPDYANAIVSRVIEWWDRAIIEGVEPPVTASSALDEYVRDTWEERTPLREATPEETALILAYDRARAEAGAAKDRQEDLAAKLRTIIADAAGIEAPGIGKATARLGNPRVDWKALATERGARLQLLGERLDDDETKNSTPAKSRTLNVYIDKKAKALK